MASFSRGFLLFPTSASFARPSICPQCIRHVKRATTRRPFTLTRYLSQQQPAPTKPLSTTFKAARPSKPQPSRTPLAKSTTASTTTKPPLTTDYLASHPQFITPHLLNTTLQRPTIIYLAPNHFAYYAAAFSLGTFLTAYGAYQYNLAYIMTEGSEVPGWIVFIMKLCSPIIMGMGIWVFAASIKIVTRITVIPRAKLGKPLLARVEVTNLNPWKRTVLEVPVADLSMVRSMEEMMIPEEAMVSLHDVPIGLGPIVRVGNFVKRYFHETKNVFMREFMVALVVPEQGNYKIDARGQAFGGAAGMDRIFKARAYGGDGILTRSR